MMDAKGVRNMYSIPEVVSKHNTARVASCWFIIYYALLIYKKRLRWSRGSVLAKFAGSNPVEAVGFLRANKSSARLPSEGK